MKSPLLASLLFAPLISFACSMDHLIFKDAYLRAMPQGQKNTAAYLEIENTSDTSCTLTAISSPIADKAELHEVVMIHHVAKMKPLKTLVLPPKSVTTFMPSGKHIMLFGVHELLAPGERVPLTMTFDEGLTKTLEMQVRDIRMEAHEHPH